MKSEIRKHEDSNYSQRGCCGLLEERLHFIFLSFSLLLVFKFLCAGQVNLQDLNRESTAASKMA